MISVAPGANKNLAQNDLKSAINLIENVSVVLLQMEIQIEVIQEIIRIAVDKRVISILNPAPFKEIPLEVLKQVDIVTPNENELLKLHSSLGFEKSTEDLFENLPKVANDLHRCGINTLVVTLGRHGCYISDKNAGEQYHVPAFKVNAIDAVGAGDCFNGVLASRLSKGDTLRVATKYANVAASIAVTRNGAQTSMPFWNEIQHESK
jgi:ribokinase